MFQFLYPRNYFSESIFQKFSENKTFCIRSKIQKDNHLSKVTQRKHSNVSISYFFLSPTKVRYQIEVTNRENVLLSWKEYIGTRVRYALEIKGRDIFGTLINTVSGEELKVM